MTLELTRRGMMRAASALAIAPVFGWDPAQAQTPGGILRVGMTSAAVPLSNGCPDQGSEGHRFMGITIYDQLVEWDLAHADRTAALRPGLATSWRVDPANQKRWVFTLREGVKFHDGKVMTAEDVIFSHDRAFKKDAPWYDPRAAAQITWRLPTLKAYGIEGPNMVWLETSVVDSTIPYNMTWIGITHQGAWEAAGKSWDTYLDKAVGTGPWKLDSFRLRERAELSRFAEHWNQARVPKCAKLVLMPIPDANTRVAALRSGQIDFAEAPSPDTVPSLKAAGFQIVTNTMPQNWTWHLSMAEGSPLRDIRVRKALNLAVDRVGMKQLLGGLMEEGTGLVTPNHPWYGKPTFKLAYDPAQAKRLLAEAGYGPSNRLVVKVATSLSGSQQMQPLPMNEYIQQTMKDVGVDVQIEVLEFSALLDLWRAGAKSPVSRGALAFNGAYGTYDPYGTFIRLLKSNLVAPAGVNWGWFSDPKYDAWLDEVYTTFDPKQQDALLAKIHENVVDDALFLFVAHDLNPRALGSQVKGFVQAQSWFQDLTSISMG